MKKIIGIIGVVLIAVTLSYNVNITNSKNTDVKLAGLIKMNVANAQEEGGGSGICIYNLGDYSGYRTYFVDQCYDHNYEFCGYSSSCYYGGNMCRAYVCEAFP